MTNNSGLLKRASLWGAIKRGVADAIINPYRAGRQMRSYRKALKEGLTNPLYSEAKQAAELLGGSPSALALFRRSMKTMDSMGLPKWRKAVAALGLPAAFAGSHPMLATAGVTGLTSAMLPSGYEDEDSTAADNRLSASDLIASNAVRRSPRTRGFIYDYPYGSRSSRLPRNLYDVLHSDMPTNYRTSR